MLIKLLATSHGQEKRRNKLLLFVPSTLFPVFVVILQAFHRVSILFLSRLAFLLRFFRAIATTVSTVSLLVPRSPELVLATSSASWLTCLRIFSRYSTPLMPADLR